MSMPFGIRTPSEPPPSDASPPRNGSPPELTVWPSLWRTLSTFQKDKVTPWIALRNTIGVVVPLAIGIKLGAAPVGIALATGAMNVSYSDSHDPYPLRGRKMLIAS